LFVSGREKAALRTSAKARWLREAGFGASWGKDAALAFAVKGSGRLLMGKFEWMEAVVGAGVRASP